MGYRRFSIGLSIFLCAIILLLSGLTAIIFIRQSNSKASAEYKITYNNSNVGPEFSYTSFTLFQNFVPLGAEGVNSIECPQGYDFMGWSTRPGGQVEFVPNKTYTITDSVKLYAVWKQKKVLISFHSNDERNERFDIFVACDEEFSLDMPMLNEFLTDSRFLGWNHNPNGGSDGYGKKSTCSFDKSTNLYAIWND